MLRRLSFVTVMVLAALVGLLKMEVWADVVVNEVMSNTGNDTELIELYNTIGSGNINVDNLTFKDGGGYSDTIVAWSTQNPTVGIPGCDTTTTVIGADSYAVILDPDYAGGHYNFPVGTIILTIQTTSALGNGLGNSESITLFDNTGNTVSSYGGWIGASADVSVERIDPDWLDVACNWAENTTSDSTPGAVNSVDTSFAGSDPTAKFTPDTTTINECSSVTFTNTSDSDGCQAITG
ncbi:lamin tail domain-containing protein, partial [bacterium]|nr:lamin tail domain-containing protein [bacterium]